MDHDVDGKESALLRAHPRVHGSRAELAVALPAPQRIVSLVPSLSEALFTLGMGSRLVGVTEYCVHPVGAFEALPKLGGTKDADIESIIGLAPDLVIANQEENTARVVRRLAEAGIDVWVTYPRTVREGVELLEEIAALGASQAAVREHVMPSVCAVEEAERARVVREASGAPRPKVFCPIWRDPWMTINRDTYIHDMLSLCGAENLFADGPEPAASAGQTERMAGGPGEPGGSVGGEAKARDPAAADRRYPIVALEKVVAAGPEVILLPDEPYAFGEADAEALLRTNCPAGRDGRVHLIDGTLVSWYGPRIAEAIQGLAAIFANP